MSTLKELKEYLVGQDGYLLNYDNNGKTVMLSGAWGSGKTHFWQNEIEPNLSDKLKADQKACVYVSLYGKDNIEAIKNEILFKAYESIKDENKIVKRAISAFGFTSRLFSISYGGTRVNADEVGEVVENFFESRKINEAESFLVDGGLICLDDFERKSKHIDLNDLFGFIAQLAIDMNCKIVIILNSDVFEGEEANVFKAVKEKTVNKFFYFEPTIEELFESIYNSNDKYERLDAYRVEILSIIKETEELNARIYIQVLDNCLEWINKNCNSTALRTLILNTISYLKYHFILKYPVYLQVSELYTREKIDAVAYDDFRASSKISDYILRIFTKKIIGEKTAIQNKIDSFYDMFIHHIGSMKIPTEEKQVIIDELDELYDEYMLKIYFGYKLYVARDIEEKLYNKVGRFIKTGILPKNPKEVESLLPQKG